MEWLERAVVLPLRRVRLGVATRLGIRSTGLGKLRKEVRTCEYADVHVMWEMLRRSSGREMERHSPATERPIQRRRS